MANINLSAAVRSNLSSLQSTATLMAKTSDRLSTGNKVNSALDNPTNFFTAASLNSRAGDLNQLMDSMANGIKTIEAADNGLSAITKTLESMQSTLRQARQDKSFQTQSFDLKDLAKSTTLTGAEKLTLGGGALGAAKTIDLTRTGTVETAATNAKASASSAIATVTSTVTTPQAPLALTADNAFVSIDLTNHADDALTFNLNGVAITLGRDADADSDNTVDIDEAIASITAQIGAATGLDAAALAGITVDQDLDGKLVFSSQTAGGHITVNNAAIVDGDGIGGAAQTPNDLGFTAGATGQTSAARPGGTTYSGGVDASAGDITFDVNGKSVTLSSTGGAGNKGHYSAENIRDAINTTVGTTAGVSAAVVAGKLVVTSTGTASATDAVKIDNFSGSADATLLGFADAAAADVKGMDASTNSNGNIAKSVDDLVKEINESDTFNVAIRASNDNGKLRIENLSTQAMTIAGANTAGLVDGLATAGKAIDGNSVRADLAKQFNELRDQLDKLSDDASFNGINLLRGDSLKITFNETGTSSIDIQAKDEKSINSTNLKLATTLTDKDLDSDTGIDTYLGQVKGALNSVRAQSSAFGSNLSIVQNRQDFTKSMINTLETGAGNLTLADMNQEAANMMALQTRQSLASSTLSMANQADQSVLQLLR